MISALNFPLSLFISMVLIPILMRYADFLGLVDTPDGIRKIHLRTIPKSGGLAIAIAAFISIAYSNGQVGELLSLLIGALIIVVFGYLDDRFDLNYKWKFFGQIIAILVFIAGAPQLFEQNSVFEIDEFSWLPWVIAFLFLLGTSNAINLSDGLDGLAAGLTFISLGLITFISFEADIISVMLVSLAMMGALMGFLRFNTHPAQVFMGDTGSQFIGFTSAGLAVYLAQSSASAINPILPLLILGLPIMDTLMVMSVRVFSGKSPFYPDKNHIHHQLMKFGFYHYEAVAILYVLQLILVSASCIFRFSDTIYLLSIYITFVIACLGFLYFANLHEWKFRSNVESMERIQDRRNPFLRNLGWIYEHGSIVILGATFLLWLVASWTSLDYHSIIRPLALGLLVASFIYGIVYPLKTSITARILSYSATVLSLYALSMTENSNQYGFLINGILIFVGLFIILAIRLTRKELFRLNNQDLIILFLLLLCPLLPIESDDGVKVGVMLFRIVVIIYAVEYIISKSPNMSIWVSACASITLFSLCFA